MGLLYFTPLEFIKLLERLMFFNKLGNFQPLFIWMCFLPVSFSSSGTSIMCAMVYLVTLCFSLELWSFFFILFFFLPINLYNFHQLSLFIFLPALSHLPLNPFREMISVSFFNSTISTGLSFIISLWCWYSLLDVIVSFFFYLFNHSFL